MKKKKTLRDWFSVPNVYGRFERVGQPDISLVLVMFGVCKLLTADCLLDTCVAICPDACTISTHFWGQEMTMPSFLQFHIKQFRQYRVPCHSLTVHLELYQHKEIPDCCDPRVMLSAEPGEKIVSSDRSS